MNSLMQAGKADDAFPVLKENGSADILWVPEIERFDVLPFLQFYIEFCRFQCGLSQSTRLLVELKSLALAVMRQFTQLHTPDLLFQK